jgi:RNA recognition motif-containing protein
MATYGGFDPYGMEMHTGFDAGVADMIGGSGEAAVQPIESAELSSARLYVGNLAWQVAWQDLKDYFKQCGNVVRADVMKNSEGRSKGCGLVEFETVEDAQEAMERLNDTELKGRRIFVREDREPNHEDGRAARPPREFQSARPAAERRPRREPSEGSANSQNVFVGNLPWDITWQQLKDLFRANGLEVAHSEVMENSNGRSKGYGIVKFSSVGAAKEAVEKMQGQELGGRTLQIRMDRDA